MEGTTLGVGVHALVAELGVLGLIAYERSGDNHLLTANKNDFLSSEQLLGDDGAEAAMEMVAAVDEDGLFEDHLDWIWRLSERLGERG